MKCPFCGSDKGYYMMETIHRALLFTFDNEPNGASEEDFEVYTGRRKYCIACNKILPRRMFAGIRLGKPTQPETERSGMI